MLLLLAPTSAPQMSYPCRSSSQVCKHKLVTNFARDTSPFSSVTNVSLLVPTSAPQLALLHSVLDCNTLQHTATHCNPSQHIEYLRAHLSMIHFPNFFFGFPFYILPCIQISLYICVSYMYFSFCLSLSWRAAEYQVIDSFLQHNFFRFSFNTLPCIYMSVYTFLFFSLSL